MEYKSNGFFTSLIERGDSVTRSNGGLRGEAPSVLGGTAVTEVLMLLAAGFVLPFDWIFSDKILGDENADLIPVKGIFNDLRRKHLKELATAGNGNYFAKFASLYQNEPKPITANSALSGWRILRVSKAENLDLETITKWIDFGDASIVKLQDRNLEFLLRNMRNAIAHGSVWPVSANQREKFGSPEDNVIPLSKKNQPREIDQVLFAAQMRPDGELTGYYVFQLSIPALYEFWNGWKQLMLRNEDINSFFHCVESGGFASLSVG